MDYFLSYTPKELVYIFFVHAFLGWVTEVAYSAIKHGKYSNRGFLIGPLCPIYGVGVGIILIILTPIKNHYFLLFICSILLTSALEFLTGWVLELKYNERWWDYTNEKFNLKGYICLKFSIIWGFACMLVVYLVNPPIMFVIRNLLKLRYGFIPGILLLVILVIDIIISNKRIREFTKNIKTIELMDEAIRKVSDTISYDIYKSSIESKDKYEELTEQEYVTKIIDTIAEIKEDIYARSDKIGANLSDTIESIRDRREERLLDRNSTLDEIETEIKARIEIFTEEREGYFHNNEKNLKKFLDKFPDLEKGRHSDIFDFFKK